MTEAKRKPATRTIEKQMEIAAPVEAVWKALTDAEELTRWFPLKARVKPGAGGSVFLSWGPECEGEAPIDVWEPNRRLRYVERAPGADRNAQSSMFVEWILEARGGKTLLRLANSGFGEGADWENEYYDSVDCGWGFMLVNLRHYLERHAGVPRVVAWPRLKVTGSREDAYERLMGADGLFPESATKKLREGGRYSARAASGEQFSGRVEFVRPPRGFCVTVENLNEALLWLTIEGSPGKHEVQLWLSTYGVPQEEVDAFRERWQDCLERTLASA